jgi:hypothetical protein
MKKKRQEKGSEVKEILRKGTKNLMLMTKPKPRFHASNVFFPKKVPKLIVTFGAILTSATFVVLPEWCVDLLSRGTF